MNQADGRTPLPADVVEALNAGKKIEAIKRLRDHTGLGLMEAKEAVEAHQSDYAPLSQRFSPGEEPTKGSVGKFLFGLALALLAGWYFLYGSR